MGRKPKSQPAPVETWEARWSRMKAEAMSEAHYKMMRDPSMRPYYLYVVPAKNGAWGRFVVDVDAPVPDGCSDVYRIPNTLAPDGLRQWLERFAGQLPMIGE